MDTTTTNAPATTILKDTTPGFDLGRKCQFNFQDFFCSTSDNLDWTDDWCKDGLPLKRGTYSAKTSFDIPGILSQYIGIITDIINGDFKLHFKIIHPDSEKATACSFAQFEVFNVPHRASK